MELIVVESPTKARMIEKFLGGKYKVLSSMGHIRDLPTHSMGVDIENGFDPDYEIIRGKKKILREIEKQARQAERLYLAMDEDREGEAIGWHLLESLSLKKVEKKPGRIVFHEVTAEAVQNALKAPREIDSNLVNAQQARRILDRIVGYRISPLLSKRIRRGLSAGRVQSAGLRMIVEREKERAKFVPREYYTVEGRVDLRGTPAEASLWGCGGKKIKKFDLGTKEQAQEVVDKCLNEPLTVKDIKQDEKKNSPPPPFITSTLQQDAYNRLKYTPARTMKIAQQLYEGVDLADGSSAGLITYMRTDSVKISAQAVDRIRKYIKENLGDPYLPGRANAYRSKKTAQEAHECIRPTDVFRTPESVSGSLTREQGELYRLIWERFAACQMRPAIIDRVKVKLDCSGYEFRISGQTVKFDGYMKIWKTSVTETVIPPVSAGDVFRWMELCANHHQTKPPARFTPATLVSELEKNGIGRPSTYATILNTLFRRKYISSENGSLLPQEIGVVVTEALEKHFEQIVNYEFTAGMESRLDEIAAGRQDWKEMLKEFYEGFEERFRLASSQMEMIKDEKTSEECPECGSDMVIRWGRNGRFMACSAYPGCRKTFNIDENGEKVKEPGTDMKCPACSKPLVVKTGRYGRFLACSGYPGCRTTLALNKDGTVAEIPLGYEKCPDCSKDTVIKLGPRGKFLACTGYPKCRFSMNLKKAR